jgi:hypothetical protein
MENLPMVYEKSFFVNVASDCVSHSIHTYKMVAYYGDASRDSPVHLAQGQPLEGEWDIEGVQWLLSIMTPIEY